MEVLGNMPKPYDVAQVQNKYPIMYEESMNTVIGQELARYNKLIGVVRSSLMDIQKAIKGLLLMDQSLEACFNSIFDGKVPEMWAKKSYVTRKPLGSYVNDLLDRLKWFQVWIDTGVPIIFWFSGIFFTQAFTTGALQNFARKYTTPIDTLAFDFDYPREQEPKEKPADGVWTRGLFFEATRWDDDKWQLEDSFPKVLFAPVPLFHLLPQPGTELRKFPCYNCPCYKVASRKGTLSTTGHSTNFVMFIRINSDRPSEIWVKRGACMLTQLDV
jgi:dynein heavy chain